MSTNELVGGIRIYLDSIETENANIGLYTTAEDMSANAAADQADIAVDDGGAFAAGDLVYVSDSVSNEWGVVDSIATNTNTLTLRVDLTNSYTTGNSGKVESSQFRWIENDVPGTDLVWKSGMLLTGGVPETVEKIDSYRGGDYATLDKMPLGLDNTSRLFATLEGSDIYLDGLRAEVIEFTIDAGSGTVTQRVQFRGKADVTKWGVGNYDLNIEPSLLGRGSSITKPVDSQDYPNAADGDIGRAIPVTMGTFENYLAKMVRTAELGDTLTWSEIGQDITDNGGVVGRPHPPLGVSPGFDQGSRKIFPVVDADTAPSLEYVVAIASTDGASGAIFTCDYVPTGLYLYVVEHNPETGISNQTGTYRKITLLEKESDIELRVTVADYYSGDLTDSASGNGSWVSFVDVKKEYAADLSPLFGFLDIDGDATDNGAVLYSYDTDSSVTISAVDTPTPITRSALKYIRMPEYAMDIVSAGSENNSIEINPLLFNSTLNSVSAFLIEPCENLQKLGSRLFEDWGLGVGYNYKQDGFYVFFDTSRYQYPDATVTLTNPDSIGDKDYTAAARLRMEDTGYNEQLSYGTHLIGVTFNFPSFPENFTFDNVYVGINMGSDVRPRAHDLETTSLATSTILSVRRFMGDDKEVLDRDTLGDEYYDLNNEDGITGTVDCIPDFYYDPAKSTGNVNFFVDPVKVSTPDGNKYTTIRKYTNFPLTQDAMLTTQENYESIEEGLLLVSRSIANGGASLPAQPYTDTMDIYQLVVMFEKRIPIDADVYTTLKGRIFNDTWGGRKTPEDLIENPVDQYEHICRLQNWSQEGDAVTEAGLAYSDAALIDTSSNLGGFDFSALSALKERRFSFQLTETEKAYTPTLKRNFCRSMWCAGYVDEDGKESLAFLPKLDSSTITDTVTLADVPDGLQPSPVEEPQAQNAFAEPFVRYGYNAASQSFDGLIGFKNIQKGVWEQSYTPGFNGTEGETMYDYLHENVWKRFREVTPAPSDMTDQYFISTYEDAKWFLTEWIDWMLLKRITVPVYYTKANTWHIGRHTYLNLPHQTAGAAQEVVIEGIAKNINAGVCTLDLVMLDRIPPSYYFRDVMFNAAGGADADWVDTTTEYGGSNDKIDTM